MCKCVYRGGGEEKVNEEETWRGYIIVRISQAVRFSSSSVCVLGEGGGREVYYETERRKQVFYGTKRRKEVYCIAETRKEVY